MRYVLRKLGFYLLAAWVALTVNFFLPQLIPGNPVDDLLTKMSQAGPVPVGEQQVLTRLLGLGSGNIFQRYWQYVDGVAHLRLGLSISNFPTPVSAEIGSAIYWTLVLVGTATVISFVLGIALGTLAGWKRGSRLEAIIPSTTLLTAMPYFWLALILVFVFATNVWHVLPAVSMVPPGTYAWAEPRELVLPVATLVIVIVPYIFRMTRAATVEALASDYAEMARLKGLPTWRVLAVHALPNAIAPVVQVIGLSFLYLAGGIVVVEFVFAFPGIGSSLVSAVSNRDVPTIQLLVLVLAGFYVFVNIVTDVVALLVTPRRRLPR